MNAGLLSPDDAGGSTATGPVRRWSHLRVRPVWLANGGKPSDKSIMLSGETATWDNPTKNAELTT